MTLQIAGDPAPLHWAEEGRVIRVEGTRISLDLIVLEYREGRTPEEIAADYETLTLPKVYAVIAYYLAHRAEVDAYVDEGRRAADATQREIESAPEYQAFARRFSASRGERES